MYKFLMGNERVEVGCKGDFQKISNLWNFSLQSIVVPTTAKNIKSEEMVYYEEMKYPSHIKIAIVQKRAPLI